MPNIYEMAVWPDYPSDEEIERQFLHTQPNRYEWSPEVWAELIADDEEPVAFPFTEEGA